MFVPPDIVTPVVLVFIITLIVYGLVMPRTHRRIMLLSVLCITILVGAVQVGFSYYLASLDQGEILGVGFESWSEEVAILPTATYESPQVSNWYCLFNLTIHIETNGSSVEFSLIDNNSPNVEYHEGNYSSSNIELALPYLYSRAGLPANWAFLFHNPSSEDVTLDYYVHCGMIEDAGLIEMTYTEVYYNLPLMLLVPFWIAVGVAILIPAPHEKLRDIIWGKQS